MGKSIGSTASLNIILAFLAIVFAFLAASLSYYRAFKINNIIVQSIEKYEGYNDNAIAEINNKLSSIGYERYVISCPSSKTFNKSVYSLIAEKSGDGICVFFHEDSSKKTYSYVITTYMTINIPIVSNFLKIPINTATKEIYGCYGNNTDYGTDGWKTSCK